MNLEACTIDSVLRRAAAAFSTKPAIIDGDAVITYGELDRNANALAHALADLGVRKGDRVASLFHNQWQLCCVYFALARLGAVIVSLNARWLPEELAHPLVDSGCRAVIYSAEFDSTMHRLQSTVDCDTWIAAGPDDAPAATHRLEDLIQRNPKSLFGFDWFVYASDDSGIWYTSGTTGGPKGAVVRNASSVWSGVATALSLRMDERARLLAVAPMFHRGAMEDVHLAGFLVGGTHVMLKRFSPEAMLGLIQEHNITHAFVVPSMTWAVLSLPTKDRYDLGSMRCWMTASAPFPEEYRYRLESETSLPPGVVFNAYGITESLLNTCLMPESSGPKRGSVGWPVPGTLLRIVSPGGTQPVPAGTVGEIATSSLTAARTYWNLAEAWSDVTFSDGGRRWYRSGDLGYLDDDGCLFIVDRVKDMIISGGENVYSVEVESTLLQHPGIAEAAVVGLPDERWGEAVAALVVAKQGESFTPDELILWCKSKLAAYKCPRHVLVVGGLPRNSFGKVQKSRAREVLRDLRQ